MSKTKAEIYSENPLNHRTDFNTLKINSKIYQKGLVVEWKKMIICPCRKDLTSQAVSDCINCNGLGFYWFDPLQIKALVSGASMTKNFLQWTEVLEGSIYVSVDPEFRIGWHDQIKIISADSVFSEVKSVFVETVEDIDYLKIRCHYEPLEIIKIYKYVSPTVSLYEIPEDNYSVLNKIITIDDINVSEGDNISILYRYNPVYLIMDLLNDYRNTPVKNKLEQEVFEKAPIRALAKKMHLVI